MTINCDKVCNIQLTLTEQEYEEINKALCSFYADDVAKHQAETHEKLWEFKDLLTAAVKG